MSFIPRTPISATNILLLKYAKENKEPITIHSVAQALSPLYTTGMSLTDIMQVLMTAYFDLVQTKEFEIPYSGNLGKIMSNVMLSPISVALLLKAPLRACDTISYEDLYTKWLAFILKDYFIARVDWCADQLDIAKPSI